MPYDQGLIVFLGTEDLEATHAFYTEGLGLKLDRDQGLCRIYAVPGGGRLGFCSHTPVVRQGRSPILTLVVHDVDGWHLRLAAAGIHAEHHPRENPRFGIYHFFVKDPNGYTVEIQRFLT